MPERIHLQVRLPKALRDTLAKLAKENDRSLNAEIVWQLERNLVKVVRLPEGAVKFEVDPDYRLTELKRTLGDDNIDLLVKLIEERMKK